MRVFLFLTLTTLLALGGYWVFAAQMIERRAATLLSDRSYLQGQLHTVTGFPLEFRTRIDAPSWRSHDGLHAWGAEEIALQAPSYRPNQITASFPPVQRLRLGATEAQLTTDGMTGRLVVTPDRQLRAAALELRSATLSPPLAIETLAAGTVSLRWIADNRYSLQAGADALRLSTALPALLGPQDGGDATRVEELDVTATAEFTRPLPLQGPWPGLQALDVTEARLAWGALRLAATGQIARSPSGLIEGGFRLTVADWQPLLALLQQLDILPPDAALMAGMFLAAQAEPGTNRVTLPLELRDAMLWLGPVALVELPAF